MDEILTLEEAVTFSNPDGTYKTALNDPVIFEALCSEPKTIRLLIDVFTMKVEHLQTQLDTRAKKAQLDFEKAPDNRKAEIHAEHALWEGKVKALLRTTVFHLRQALRRASMLWDDPIMTLEECRKLIASDMDDYEVLEAIDELITKALAQIAESHPVIAEFPELKWPNDAT